MAEAQLETTTLAGGCFWCTEAIFKRVKGVIKVDSGYSGGQIEKPSYEDVSSGRTGHAEAIQITFDPQIITFEKILDIFWATHDPTTLDRQGNDIGTQYRSVIFYNSPEQKTTAEKSKLEHQSKYSDPIVTEFVPYTNFYKAEDYHQDYYDQNRSKNAYCPIVIDPKIQKLMKNFKTQVKDEFL